MPIYSDFTFSVIFLHLFRLKNEQTMKIEKITGREILDWYGCSPFKVVRELGLERRETVRSLSAVGAGELRGAAPSTRGPEWTHHWCSGCHANGTAR